MITTKNLVKTVAIDNRQLTILSNINIQVEASDSLAVIGPSGSGKSTLLGLLAGLDQATSGSIDIGNYCLTTMTEEQRAQVRAELVGFVFQNFQLLPGFKALENVALPLELRGEPKATQIAKTYLDRVGLADRASHYPRQLSGGEQQRVALARAFACRPKVLFADEPTGNLDAETGQLISDILFDLNEQEGTTLVLVTHEQRLAQRCARQLKLEAGVVV